LTDGGTIFFQKEIKMSPNPLGKHEKAKVEAEKFVNNDNDPGNKAPRAVTLAEEHWMWLRQLFVELDVEVPISLLEFMYTTAFIHGYGHGVEDVQRRSF
jgi:hypothetical protein